MKKRDERFVCATVVCASLYHNKNGNITILDRSNDAIKSLRIKPSNVPIWNINKSLKLIASKLFSLSKQGNRIEMIDIPSLYHHVICVYFSIKSFCVYTCHGQRCTFSKTMQWNDNINSTDGINGVWKEWKITNKPKERKNSR